ncbi:MAG TPA: ABC transporter ATP-binding protein [Thermoanaerobaculia bacterium]|nr:ABC transporter ATP-binding protein [Thermoanaerobaculia bacterium]
MTTTSPPESAEAAETARSPPRAERRAGSAAEPAVPQPRGETVGQQPPVIELEGLGIRFGRHQVLDDLTGRFDGRCIGLLGPNGAGKTTLLHALLGFYPPSAGTARIFGHDILKDSKAIQQLIGYMPERDAFIAGMSGVRFVRLMAEVSGLPARKALERAHEVFFYVGLGEARYRNLETYSLGMKQLAKLAQAIVHGPRLIFLDEPTNGLDPPARVRMLRLIREIRDSGKAQIIISSHLLRDVEECCEEVLILKRGKIANYCNLEEERRSNKRFLEIETRRTEAARERAAYSEGGARVSAQDSFAGALRELGCEVAVVNRRRLKAVLPEGVEIRDLYQAAHEREIQIRRLDYKRDSLEDIFMKAMGTDDGGL